MSKPELQFCPMKCKDNYCARGYATVEGICQYVSSDTQCKTYSDCTSDFSVAPQSMGCAQFNVPDLCSGSQKTGWLYHSNISSNDCRSGNTKWGKGIPLYYKNAQKLCSGENRQFYPWDNPSDPKSVTFACCS